jgi:hypothetical protein
MDTASCLKTFTCAVVFCQKNSNSKQHALVSVSGKCNKASAAHNPFRLGPVAVKKWTIPHLCVCTTVCGCPKINPPGILPGDQFYRNQLTEWAAGCLSAASKYHYYYDKCAHICYPGRERERKRGCTSMWRQPGERDREIHKHWGGCAMDTFLILAHARIIAQSLRARVRILSPTGTE